MRFLATTLAVLLMAGSALPAAAQYERSQFQSQQPYGQVQQDSRDGRPGNNFGRDGSRGRGIRITSALYGAGSQSCQATRPVARACNGEARCTVRANNRLCGDPAQNVVKALTVSYNCHGRSRSVTRPEGRSVSIRCD